MAPTPSPTHAPVHLPELEPPIICADENSDCSCRGTLVFGKKFVDGVPGEGKVNTCEQTMQGRYKMTNVTGAMKCSSKVLGDPNPGYYKHCCCVDIGIKQKM